MDRKNEIDPSSAAETSADDLDFDALPAPSVEPAETKPAETKPIETDSDKLTQPDDPLDFDALPAPSVEPAETKPAETKPIETDFDKLTQPDDPLDFDALPTPSVEPAETKPAETKPAETDFDALPAPSKRDAPDKAVIPFDELPSPTEGVQPPLVAKQKTTSAKREVVTMTTFVNDFWLLLMLFVSLRGLSLLLLKPGGFIRDWSDFDTYFGIATLSDYGLYPFLDFWLEWPPPVPWLAVGAYQTSLWLPAWPDDPRLWFVLLLGGVFLCFEVGSFIMIHRLATLVWPDSPPTVSRVLWIYLGLFVPLYAMLGFFDGIALFFILLSLDWLLRDRRLPSAIAVGIGFTVKIIPILTLPIAARYLWHRHRANKGEAQTEIGLYLVATGLTILAVLAPFILYGSEWLLTSARSMLDRSAWETVWAIADGYYGFGAVGGDRFNPAETDFAIHEGQLPSWFYLVVTLIFAALYLPILTAKADYDEPRAVVALAGLTISTFLLYNKGYSPQFLVYLLPFICLIFPNQRGVVYSLILMGLNVIEQPLYFVLAPSAEWLLVTAVVTRFGILLLITAEFLLHIWPDFSESLNEIPAYRALPLITGIAAAIGLLILTPLVGYAYINHQRSTSPASVFIDFMQAEAKHEADTTLILTNQQTYRQLYPHLRTTVDVRLAGGDVLYDSAAPFSTLLEDRNTVWFLPTGQQQAVLTQRLNRFGSPVIAYNFDGFGALSRYDLGTQDAQVAPVIARFANGIELVSYDITLRRNVVEVTLFWQAVSPQLNSLTVFTQLLNAQGEYLSGHDGLPNNGLSPTNTWAVNTIQRDRHPINLPTSLPSDGVIIIAGLYNSIGERMAVNTPAGPAFPNRAVTLPLLD